MVGYDRITYQIILLGGNMNLLSYEHIMLGELYVGNIFLCDVL